MVPTRALVGACCRRPATWFPRLALSSRSSAKKRGRRKFPADPLSLLNEITISYRTVGAAYEVRSRFVERYAVTGTA